MQMYTSCMRKLESLLSLFPPGCILQFEFERGGLRLRLSYQTPWRLTTVGRFVTADDLCKWDQTTETDFLVGVRNEFLNSLEAKGEESSG